MREGLDHGTRARALCGERLGDTAAVHVAYAFTLLFVFGGHAHAQQLPWLAVWDERVDDAALGKGQRFTFSVRVVNYYCESASGTLRYRRSSDSDFSTFTEVGTDPLDFRSCSYNTWYSITLTAPDNLGTYYYWACPEPSRATTPCSNAVPVTVFGPDLVVESPTVSHATVAPGASFTFGSTVRNRGPSASGATTLRYERRTDTGATWTVAGTSPVGSLGEDQSGGYSATLTAPVRPDIYAYRACVDVIDDELTTENNCSDDVTVVVIGPDLTVELPTVESDTIGTGRPFMIATTVTNQGLSASAATTLRYERRPPGSATFHAEGASALAGMRPSESRTETFTLTAPDKVAGVHHYRVCVDTVADEDPYTDNNCSGTVRVTVEGSDLVVDYVQTSAAAIGAGSPMTLTAAIRNRGIAARGRSLFAECRCSGCLAMSD